MNKIKKQINYVLDIIYTDVTFFGSLVFYLFFTIYQAILRNYLFSIKLLLALVLSYLITITIRILYYKERPNKQKYSNIIEKIDSSSFPSMHSMRSFILFYLVFINMNNLFSALFLIIFIGVVSSRYYLKKHYIIDLFVGIVLGFLIVRIVEALI